MKIQEQHLDTFRHVNNATYLQILEEARWDWITNNGYGLKRIEKTCLGPVILEINIQFRKELALHEEITIESSLLDYKGKIAHLEQEIFVEPQKLCCSAKFTFALFDTQNRKIVLPTQEWLKALS